MKWLWVTLCAVLCGCAAPQIKEVKVPVYTPCVSQTVERPKYETPSVSDEAPDGEKVLALVRDWIKSRVYEQKLEAIVEACR